jgi:hypothetical protein
MKRNILIALFLLPFLTHAQNTLYFMESLPRSNSYNPAFMPGCVDVTPVFSARNDESIIKIIHILLKSNYFVNLLLKNSKETNLCGLLYH